FEGFLAPRIPIHRVMSMQEKIGTFRMKQPVRMPVSVGLCFGGIGRLRLPRGIWASGRRLGRLATGGTDQSQEKDDQDAERIGFRLASHRAQSAPHTSSVARQSN